MKLKNNTISLDDTDKRILHALQEDARQTYTAIGKSLDIAHSTVYERIKKMEKQEVIKGYTAVVDQEKIGVKSVTAIMNVYTDPKETEKVAQKLSELSEILEVYTSISEELLIIAKVLATSPENLHTFISNTIAPLHGVLRIRTSMITKKLKENGFSISIR